jgi:hypothetical protein
LLSRGRGVPLPSAPLNLMKGQVKAGPFFFIF